MATTTFPSRSEASNTATAGKDYLIYLNAGESDTNPTWLLLGGQRSGDLSRQADEIDASSKTSNGWKSLSLQESRSTSNSSTRTKAM